MQEHCAEAAVRSAAAMKYTHSAAVIYAEQAHATDVYGCIAGILHFCCDSVQVKKLCTTHSTKLLCRLCSCRESGLGGTNCLELVSLYISL